MVCSRANGEFSSSSRCKSTLLTGCKPFTTSHPLVTVDSSYTLNLLGQDMADHMLDLDYFCTPDLPTAVRPRSGVDEYPVDDSGMVVVLVPGSGLGVDDEFAMPENVDWMFSLVIYL